MGINPRNIHLPARHPLSYPAQFAIGLGLLGIGLWVDRKLVLLEHHRMTRFRDKSAMFGKVKADGEPPSWGTAGPYPNWARINLAKDA